MAPRQTGIGYKKRRVRAGGLKKASSEEKPIGGKANKAEQQAQTPPTPPVLKTPSKLKAPAVVSRVVVDPLVKSVYKVVTKKTELDWGLTSDWKVDGPRRRTARLPADEQPEAPQPAETSKHGASEGYGEMTEGSIQRVLNTLKNMERQKISDTGEILKLDQEHRLSSASTFIDVGSGYGKVVLHAAADVGVRSSVGIEMVQSRHELASGALRDLLAGRCKGISAQQAQRLSVCSFKGGDATAEPSLSYSHVYMYDYVFNEVTLKDLAQLLNASTWRVLVSYRDPAVWRKQGLANFKRVETVKMNTTGGQNFTAHVYAFVADKPSKAKK